MSEAIKENPKTPKRSKRKPAMEPLGWDEIVSQPGMGGYLSFLNGPIPLPHLQTPGIAEVPGVDSSPAQPPPLETSPGVNSAPLALSPPTPEISPEDAVAPAAIPDPEVALTLDAETNPELVPASQLERDPVDTTTTEAISIPEALPVTGAPETAASVTIPVVESATSQVTAPGLKQPQDVNQSLSSDHSQESYRSLHLDLVPGTAKASGVISLPAFPPNAGFERPNRIRIRKCFSAQDGHSLGEEVLYQALWKNALPVPDSNSRTITVGWRGMSQLCRMTPKNCKINTQRLLRKLALDILSPYNTPESVGTTYRIYSSDEILQRRHTAGLEWVIRSRGVEFVDPRTGNSITAQMCGNAID